MVIKQVSEVQCLMPACELSRQVDIIVSNADKASKVWGD